MEGKDLLDGGTNATVQLKADAGLRYLLASFQLEPQLDEKQFLENQPDVSRSARGLQVLQALAGLWPMHSPECFPRRDQIQAAAHGRGNRIRQVGEIVQRGVDHATEPPRSQPSLPDGLVNRHNPANFERGGDFLLSSVERSLVTGLTHDFELRLHDLQFAAAIIRFHLSVEGN